MDTKKLFDILDAYKEEKNKSRYDYKDWVDDNDDDDDMEYWYDEEFE